MRIRAAIVLLALGCGVKAPPRPPIQDTPAAQRATTDGGSGQAVDGAKRP